VYCHADSLRVARPRTNGVCKEQYNNVHGTVRVKSREILHFGALEAIFTVDRYITVRKACYPCILYQHVSDWKRVIFARAKINNVWYRRIVRYCTVHVRYFTYGITVPVRHMHGTVPYRTSAVHYRTVGRSALYRLQQYRTVPYRNYIPHGIVPYLYSWHNKYRMVLVRFTYCARM